MKRKIIRTVAALVIFAAALITNIYFSKAAIILFAAAYIIAGYDVIYKAARNIKNGQVFDENFLMAIASIGAFFIGEYPEGAAVMIFYRIGEIFEDRAVERSRRLISSLVELRPEYANVVRDGKTVECDPYDVQIGDVILVRPGERIPLDGVVISGHAMLDTSALTGESLPREVNIGDELQSGCINLNEVITVRVTREFSDSAINRILELVEEASEKKSRQESFITKFARVYTPIVVITAVFLAVVPPLVIPGQTFSDWIYRALLFLVVSCPCALVISVPLGFFGGIGASSKLGILIKGSNYIETLANTDTFVFDKTGTLTRGVFEVQKICCEGTDEETLLYYASHAECFSNHPISKSLKEAYGKAIDETVILEVSEISGHGVSAKVSGHDVLAGNLKLMERFSVDAKKCGDIGTLVYVAVDGKYLGCIVISDEIKADSREAIDGLKSCGVEKTVMLTGDLYETAKSASEKIGIDEVYAQLLPDDKLSQLEKIMDGKSNGRFTAFVGDGINDAPVLARADVGVAMGGLGSDAAIEAADIVIMDDKPSKLASAIKISKRTLRIVRQNIVFALGVKGIVLVLGALGFASMWAAVFADVGVSVIAILNAMRVLNVGALKK